MAAKNATNLASFADLFGMLSDKTRLQIVLTLASGPSNVTGLCESLKLRQPTVSHHLGLLRMLRVIVSQRKGKQVMYSLAENAKVSGGKVKISLAPFALTIEGW